MGCKESTTLQTADQPAPAASGGEAVFGTGVHVGREGNVDLTGRKLDFLGAKMVKMIMEDELHREAVWLTLTDNKLYTLGKELSFLPNLQQLDMDSNKFQRFPEILTQLPKLWRINASKNPLDAVKGFDVLPRLSALRSLVLQDCGFLHVPTRLMECPTIEELDLSHNSKMKFGEMVWSRLVRLRRLSIGHCGVGGRSLPSSLKKLTTLESLDISGSNFIFDDPAFFGGSLPNTLKELHLRDMQLTAVPQIVVSLRKLVFLDLAENPIETLDVLAGRIVKRLPRVGSAGTLQQSGNNSPLAGAVPSVSGGDLGTATNTGGNGVGGGGVGGDNDSDGAESRVSTSSRISMSKASKAGMVAHVAKPIPLKKLSLRACGLTTVPKYFHKLQDLEELDLSENDLLDDPNMTLFSLQSLRVLNIVGCPFADDVSRSRNEWFDIAKLRNLRDVQWEQWKGTHNMSPYRTKIPVEICGLNLQRLNEVQLRRGLFVGDTVETVMNLERDGYFKVDLAIDDNTVYSLVEALSFFTRGEQFFFPKDIPPRKPAADGSAFVANAASPTTAVYGKDLGMIHLKIAVNRYIFFLAMQAANYDAIIIPPLDVMILHYAQITTNPVKYRTDCEAICGRILNCNYRDFFIEQLRHPAAAKDAVAASKRIWNLMVRSAQQDLTWLRYDFWDRRARALKDSTGVAGGGGGAPAPSTSATGGENASGSSAAVGAGSAKTASAATPAQRGSTATAAGSSSSSGMAAAHQYMQSLPVQLLGLTDEDILHDYDEMRSIDATENLCGVLDQAITSHFIEQGFETFHTSLVEFYRLGHCFFGHEEMLRTMTLDWSRYVKYLALYAYRVAVSKGADNTVVMEPIADADGNLYSPMINRPTSSLLGPHYDRLMEPPAAVGADAYLPQPTASALTKRGAAPRRSFSGLAARRSSSLLSTAGKTKQQQSKTTTRINAMQNFKVNPIPTVGIMLLLHAHRTSHVKYYQTLSLFGIEDLDIEWNSSRGVVEQTCRAWEALYDESYIGDASDFGFITIDGVTTPLVPKRSLPHLTKELQAPPHAITLGRDGAGSRPATSTLPPPTPEPAVYSPTAPPRTASALKRRAANPSTKKVTLCSADTQLGIF